jgi:hypothetical protein
MGAFVISPLPPVLAKTCCAARPLRSMGVTSCSTCPCHRAVPTTPPECHAASVSPRHAMLPSPRSRGLGLRTYFLSRPLVGSLSLRPGDSLTIPRMALSVGFIRFVSSTDATQATKPPTLALVGLTPTEHASLGWTRCLAKITLD